MRDETSEVVVDSVFADFAWQIAGDILLGVFFLKLSFLNFLLFSVSGVKLLIQKILKRFRKGAWGITLLQKGFPQLFTHAEF